MPTSTAFIILTLSLAAVSSLAVAAYAWPHRSIAGARPFAWLMAAAAEWSIFNALEVITPSIAAKLSFSKLELVGVVIIPVAWFAFTREYAGRRSRLTYRSWVLLSIIPVITVLLAFFSEAHQLIWTELKIVDTDELSILVKSYGPWYWLSVAYSYGLSAVGVYLVIAMTARSRGIYRVQIVAVLIAGLVPFAVNVLYLAGALIVDVTPLTFAISGGLLAWAIFRYRLLDLVPVAQEVMIEDMSDGMLVLDQQRRIITLNPAAERILNVVAASATGQPIDQVIPEWASLVQSDGDLFEMPDEVTLNAFEYELRVSPLHDRQGSSIGHLLTLHDMTRRKQIAQRVQAQNNMLENLIAVAHATTEYSTLTETLHNILEVGESLTVAERGGLILLDASGLVVNSITGLEAKATSAQNRTAAQLQDNGVVAWVAAKRQLLLIEDTRQDKRWIAVPGDDIPVRSVLAAPITRGSALLGVLILLHSQPGHFTAEHAQLIRAAVDQMSLTVQNAQAYEAQRRMADRQTTLYEVLRAVGSQLDPDSVARVAADEIAHLTDWQNIVIATVRPDHETLQVRAGTGTAANAVGYVLEPGRGVTGRAFATGRTQCLSDVSLDPDYVQVDPETRSELAVLLRRGARIRGVLNIESAQLAAFDTYDISLAESLADAVGLALDNAQLYQAIREEHSQLQAMIDSSHDGIALLNLDRSFLISNAHVVEFLGLTGEPKDLIGRSLFDVLEDLRQVAGPAAEALVELARRLQRDNEASSEIELEIPPRAVHWSTLPVLSGGAALGRLIVIRDITAERELDRARDDLTRMMVHDLRNPLGAISSAFELLTMVSAQSLSALQNEVIEVGQQAAQRMMNLVTAILDVSRFENGLMPVERRPTALTPLIEEALQLQTVLADKKEIQLTRRLSSDLPLALIDPDLIGRVVQNIVGNAIKFTPPSGTICISTDIDPSDRASVRISISDTGPGISPEIQGRLFQKFVTGPIQERGSGLGLAFSRLAVEAHGGRIWADSKIGQGTTFHFTLPIA